MSLIKPIVITIDGPAGVGKSSLAHMLATALNLPMLDTGAMYRTLGLKLGTEIMDMPDSAIEKKISLYPFALCGEGAEAFLTCAYEPLDPDIRSERASRLSSLVAQLPAVRSLLQENQRIIAQTHSLVAEGRDMGTAVFPHAECKFFLDATSEVRAKRRYDELVAKNEKVDFPSLLKNLIERDATDRTRKINPLKPADDAVIIDTSHLSIDEVFNILLHHVNEKVNTTMANTNSFSHLDNNGNATMVDVSAKQASTRKAIVACTVEMNANTLALLKENALPKGDVLNTAKIAGILAAKQTANLIPLCHPIAITHADIRFIVQDNPPAIHIEAEAKTTDKTGVEMEALIAAQIAAATIYDMCKAVQKDIVIQNCRLIYKSGGKSGEFINR